MSEAELLLNSLRDISEPGAPNSAPAWIIVANALAFLILVAVSYRFLRFKKKSGWFEAQLKLRQSTTMPLEQGLLNLANVIREVVLLRSGECPKITGEEWLTFLNHYFSTNWFTQAEGRIFGNAIYQPLDGQSVNLTQLSLHLETLIQQLPERYQNHRQESKP